MTCGRGRGLIPDALGLDAGVDEAGVDEAGVDGAGVISVMWSDPGCKSMPPFLPKNPKRYFLQCITTY
jgi:hypothetical protein